MLQKRFGWATTAWRVETAGTWPKANEPVHSKTLAIAREWNLHLNGHRSRCVNRQLLRSFNLILTMEQGQKEALRIEFPEVADRVYVLSEMAGEVHDIADPYDGSLADHKQMARDIDYWLRRGFQRICQLAREREVSR
jgi:protein-tyrosine-phosphatase